MSIQCITLRQPNLIALWRNRALTTPHAHPTAEEMQQHLLHNNIPKFPAVPAHYFDLDEAGFTFTFEDVHDKEGKRWGWDHLTEHGTPDARFSTLEGAVKNAYWHHIGLYDRIYRAQQQGIKVEPAALGEGVHYWRFERGNRVSALFPTEEAAWRDAIRVHENAVEKVKADPGIPRVRGCGAAYTLGWHRMKAGLETLGYSFTEVSWRTKSGPMNTLDGGLEAVVLDAWRHHLGAEGMSAVNMGMTHASPGYTHADDALTSAVEYVSPPCQHHAGIDLAQSRAEGMEPAESPWEGVGQPPPGTTLWVTPHNTLWGFDLVDHYLCEVLAYHSDYVWLQLLSDTGEVVLGKYVTTRTDKVDVKVWRGNNP